MAVDMFLELKDIQGEAQDDVYKAKNAIDVLAWSWGLSQSGTTHLGAGAGAGKVNVQDISFTKYIDKGSTALMLCCCKGTHIPEGTLTVRKAGDKPLEYLKIYMKEILVSSVSTGGSGGEDRLTENIALNFAKVKVEYTEQKKDGSKGVTKTLLWNVPGNIDKFE